jgi:PAS domain S-box-containing protein
MENTSQSAISRTPIHPLLVGDNDQDFSYLRDLLSQTGDGLLGLDHARSPEEALVRLGQTSYDLLLCQYESGDGRALRLLHEVREDGPRPPVIFLSDHVHEATVDAALNAGTGDLAQMSSRDEPSLMRTIRCAIDVYCKERQRQKAEDTLRKLWRAVEQSADLVMLTDRTGVIEYVNPAFEALTGYSARELMGQTPRVLRSGQQSPDLYKELWQTILSGNVFRCTMVNRKKNGDVFVAEKTITPVARRPGQDHAFYLQ